MKTMNTKVLASLIGVASLALTVAFPANAQDVVRGHSEYRDGRVIRPAYFGQRFDRERYIENLWLGGNLSFLSTRFRPQTYQIGGLGNLFPEFDGYYDHTVMQDWDSVSASPSVQGNNTF